MRSNNSDSINKALAAGLESKVVEINGKQHNLVITDSSEAEDIKLSYRDYFELNYFPQSGINISVEAEVSELSPHAKGEVGEEITKAVLELTEQIITCSPDTKAFDLLANGHWLGRIDAKLSFPCKPNGQIDYYRWQFWLSSGKRRKDYNESCDFLFCIGIRPGTEPTYFLIPSDAPEIINNKKHIPIPLKWQNSKYAKWHYNPEGPLPEALICAMKKAIELLENEEQ